MPKKKNKQQKNAFYFYMMDLMPDLRREGRALPNGMADVVVVAHPRWKLLPAADKERYERMAAEEKKKNKGPRGDEHRLDNVGNIIAERKDKTDEWLKRQQKESRITKSRLPEGDALRDHPLYFMSMEYLCKTEEGYYLPCEIGMIEFTFNRGITNTYHKFIKPEKIPLGYRFQCQSHSDDTHQIPVEYFEEADDNYRGILIQMENFINKDGNKREWPPVYCLAADIPLVEFTMEWLHARACVGRPNRIQKIFELENLVCDLHHLYEKSMTHAAAREMMCQARFDYLPNTRCSWHEEKETKHCAVFTVNRCVYCLFDSDLTVLIGYEVKEGTHVPRSLDTHDYTVYEMPAIEVKPIKNITSNRQVYTRQNYNTSLSQAGPYASRDIRYNAGEDDDEDNGQSSLQKMELSQSLRKPMTSTGAAPWKDAAALACTAPDLIDDGDFPALGGGGEKNKFAGRAGPPPAAYAPQPPSSWCNSHAETMAERAAKFGPKHTTSGSIQPHVVQNVPKQVPVKPTLQQAVLQKEEKLSLGEAVQSRNQPQTQKLSLGQAVQQRHQESEKPSLGQAVHSQQRAQGIGRGILGGPRQVNSVEGGRGGARMSAPRTVTAGWAPGGHGNSQASSPWGSTAPSSQVGSGPRARLGAPRSVNSWGSVTSSPPASLSGEDIRPRLGAPRSVNSWGSVTSSPPASLSGEDIRPRLGAPRSVNSWGSVHPSPPASQSGEDTMSELGAPRSLRSWSSVNSSPPGSIVVEEHQDRLGVSRPVRSWGASAPSSLCSQTSEGFKPGTVEVQAAVGWGRGRGIASLPPNSQHPAEPARSVGLGRGVWNMNASTSKVAPPPGFAKPPGFANGLSGQFRDMVINGDEEEDLS